MKRPKGKLFALVAIFAALGVAAGTGAFSTVTAERTAEVGVSGDASAALGLDTADEDYASLNNGQLEITFTSVNQNATTAVDGVFTIQNNDPNSDTIAVSISDSGPHQGAITWAVPSDDGDDISWADGDQASIENTTVDIDSGNSVTVGMYIDTSDGDATDGIDTSDPTTAVTDGEDIITSITIEANGS